MRSELISEIERLTANATGKREDLLRSGLKRSGRRKALTVAAGILALTSAGTITAAVTRVFGSSGMQLLAALAAGISGTVSLFITSYYADDAILTMLLGSAKYLALRENVYRLVIEPKISDSDRFKRLADFQAEYARLDEIYSRFFTLRRGPSQRPPKFTDRKRELFLQEAEAAEYERVHKAIVRATKPPVEPST